MDGYRARDSAAGEQVALFLDEKLYPKIGAVTKRVTDREAQLRGVDLYLSYGDLSHVSVDEKAMTHYVNKDLPTSAFELSSIQQGAEIEGWLTDVEKETEYYLVVWLWARESWNFLKEDISKVRCLLISRKKILDYLKGEGFDVGRLRDKSRIIRESGAAGKIDDTGGSFYFFLSDHLAEKPINVVIRRKKLMELAEGDFIVSE